MENRLAGSIETSRQGRRTIYSTKKFLERGERLVKKKNRKRGGTANNSLILNFGKE